MEMTSEQKRLVSNYQTKMYERRMDEITSRVKDRMSKQPNSNVTPMLKVRVVDASRPSEKAALISLWSPSEEAMLVLKENHFNKKNLRKIRTDCSAEKLK